MKHVALRFGFLFAAVATLATSLGASSRDGWFSHPTLRPVHVPLPPFPERMHHEGYHRGTVRILFEVNTRGEVVDQLVTAETHRAFGAATEATVARWQFEPAPVVHIAELTLDFETRGVIVVVKNPDHSGHRPSAAVSRTCAPAELDSRPRPLHVVPPAYSTQLEEAGTAGTVTVEYFIDEHGRVRMPMTEEGAHPLLAGLAIAAVREWRFEPPTCAGRPALVRAAQLFRFGGAAAAEEVDPEGTS